MRYRFYKITLILMISILLAECVAKRGSLNSDKEMKKIDPAAFDFVYIEAIKQKILGNGGDALKYLEQCLKINPNSDAAYYQMAQIVLSSGDNLNAKKYVEKAYKLDERNVWYILMLSGIYYQNGNIDSAIYIYEKATKFYPEKQNLKLTLANLYLENKEFVKSNNIYSELEKRYGVNESTTPGYVNSLLNADNFSEALSKAEELISNFPAEIQYYALLAEIYRKKGDRDKAQAVYEKLLEQNPDNPQIQLSVCDFLLNEQRYDDFFLLLNNVILNSEISREDKLSMFARLIGIKQLTNEISDKILLSILVLEATFPNDDIVLLLRPEFLDNIERDKEAIIRLEEIISKKPGNYYAWEKLLLLYMQTGNFLQLMIKGEECASKFNRSFLAKLLFANGALENGKYDIALEELKKAMILAGDSKPNMVQVLIMRADVYYRMKDYNKSFEVYDEAIKLDNEDLTILNNYAYYLAEQNIRLKEAEEMARKVVEKEKDNDTFLDTYAWVLFKKGKTKDAAKIMESIISKGTNTNAEYFEHYAFILKSMKKCEKAIENWTKAISLDSTKTNLNLEIHNCIKR